jgi:hypothetical protein
VQLEQDTLQVQQVKVEEEPEERKDLELVRPQELLILVVGAEAVKGVQAQTSREAQDL